MTGVYRLLALVVVAVAVVACGSASPTPASATAPPDPCATKGSPGAVCTEVRPVANPVALANGTVRLVFDGELPRELGLGRDTEGCRVVDIDATGARVVASGCCSPGAVAAALDQDERFYLLCARSAGDDRRVYVAQRLEAHGGFTTLPDSVAFSARDTAGADVTLVRDRLLIAGRTIVVAHDVGTRGGGGAPQRTYVQPLRAGTSTSLVESNGPLFLYYSIGDVLYGLGSRVAEGAVEPFELGVRPRVRPTLPPGSPSPDCAAWSGASLRPGHSLGLRLVMPGSAGRAVTVEVPGAHAAPSATSRGVAPPICNGGPDDAPAPLSLGDRVIAADALPRSAVASCGPAGCLLVFTTDTEGAGQRFHIRRISVANGVTATP